MEAKGLGRRAALAEGVSSGSDASISSATMSESQSRGDSMLMSSAGGESSEVAEATVGSAMAHGDSNSVVCMHGRGRSRDTCDVTAVTKLTERPVRSKTLLSVSPFSAAAVAAPVASLAEATSR